MLEIGDPAVYAIRMQRYLHVVLLVTMVFAYDTVIISREELAGQIYAVELEVAYQGCRLDPTMMLSFRVDAS